MLFIDFLLSLAFLVMTIGYLMVIVDTVRKRKIKQLVYILLIPFYLFYYILKLPESTHKKVLSIICIGVFWFFFFMGIVKIVFTPPV